MTDVLIVLIENKVDANLQHRQTERYRQKPAHYVGRGLCSAGKTVLVAPDIYFGSVDGTLGFNSRVTYESILEWVLEAEGTGPGKELRSRCSQAPSRGVHLAGS